MMVGRVMGAGTGKHTISMKLAQGSADRMSTFCGVVRDGAPCNEWHGMRESTLVTARKVTTWLEGSSQARRLSIKQDFSSFAPKKRLLP